jgi:hypothetical protein
LDFFQSNPPKKFSEFQEEIKKKKLKLKIKLKLLQSQALDTVETEAKDLVVHFWVLFFSPWRMFHLCNLAAQS